MKTRTAANKRRSRFVGGGVRQLYPNFIFTESPSASEVIQTSFTEKTLHYPLVIRIYVYIIDVQMTLIDFRDHELSHES